MEWCRSDGSTPFIETVTQRPGADLRATAGLYAVLVVSLLAPSAGAQQSPPAVPPAPPTLPQQAPTPPGEPLSQTPNPALGPISEYLGLPVRDIRVVGVATREKGHLIQLLPQKAGQPLDRELVRQSLKVLFDSGLFADVQVLAEKTPDNQVVLTFTTVNNYFIGSIAAEGDPGRPSANQIVSVTKLQLGEVYSPEKLQRANKNILQVMADNGYYRASVTHDEHPHPETSQLDITFRITPGLSASVGEVNLLQTLLPSLERAHPDWECVISTTTKTGFKLAQEDMRIRGMGEMISPACIPATV